MIKNELTLFKPRDTLFETLFQTKFYIYELEGKKMENNFSGFTKPLRLGNIKVKNKIWNSRCGLVQQRQTAR
jgi:hypothetical protein